MSLLRSSIFFIFSLYFLCAISIKKYMVHETVHSVRRYSVFCCWMKAAKGLDAGQDDGSFVYALLRNRNDPRARYNPYDLQIVSAHEARSQPVYYSASAVGITRVWRVDVFKGFWNHKCQLGDNLSCMLFAAVEFVLVITSYFVQERTENLWVGTRKEL